MEAHTVEILEGIEKSEDSIAQACADTEDAAAMKRVLKMIKSMPLLMINEIEQNLHLNKQYISKTVEYKKLAVDLSVGIVYNKKYPLEAPKDLKRKRASDDCDSE